MSRNDGWDANGWEREPFSATDTAEPLRPRHGGAMNRGANQAANEAATRANDARVARAKTCPGCGRIDALGHYALCPDDPDFAERTEARGEDEDRFNDEGCAPGGWARSPI